MKSFLDVQLLIAELSTTELSRPYDRSWCSRFSITVDEIMIREVLLPKVRDDPKRHWSVAEFFSSELAWYRC